MKLTALKVEDFADVFSGGTPSTRNSAFWDGGIPWITPKDLAGYEARYIAAGQRDISEEGLKNSSARLLPGDAVLLTTRAPIGYVALAATPLATNQGFKNLVCKRDLALPAFIYYLLKHSTALLESQATGATFKELSASRLKAIILQLPDIVSQERIADILTAYDDLIENNRRRIAILEKAARQIYREWFVRLRFPGHEHTRINNGVPQGWERRTLAELCESINYGYTASAALEEIGPKFLRITDIVPSFIDWSAVPHCAIEEERLRKFRLREGDIVIARTGATVGYAKRLQKRHPESVFASYLVRLRLKPDMDNLLIGAFVESDDYKSYVHSCVGGAAQPNANAKVLAAVKILVSPQRVQCDFHDLVEPLVDEREVLQLQNQNLKIARDLLLPRLMSGEIAV
jgi:type I restriction enzyme S subunit